MTWPIILEKPITLYDATGKALRSYKLELGDVIRKNRTVMTQNADQWNSHFRSSNGRTGQLNLPEAYATIEQMYESKHPALEEFFENLTKNGLILHTRFDYARDTTTHYFDDDEKLEISSHIPEESGRMGKLLTSSFWIDAVQKMLLCKDAEKAVEVLSNASGRVPFLDMPSHESRLNYPVRAAWFGCSSNNFILSGINNLNYDDAARGVRRGASVSKQEAPAGREAQKNDSAEKILRPVTKEIILPAARPYISGYDWETFSARIPDQAPALGDVMLAAHKDSFVCDFARPEFNLKIRELYFPLPQKKDKKE